VPLKLNGKRGHERAAQGEVTREITKENVKSVDWLHANGERRAKPIHATRPPSQMDGWMVDAEKLA
jgi:hypothetical protein